MDTLTKKLMNYINTLYNEIKNMTYETMDINKFIQHSEMTVVNPQCI